MTMQADVIVDIPAERVKFFGTTGKMLLPCPATVAALIEQIPTDQLMTTDRLLQQLTAQFDVQGTCPVTTKKAIKALANDPTQKIAYWRVVNKNGGLVANYPGGVEGHAAQLRAAGFTIDTSAKAPRVKDFTTSLVQ